MLVVAAQVAVVGRRRAEEDGWRQVVAAGFAELVHFSRDAGLDGHSVTCQGESRPSNSRRRWAHRYKSHQTGEDGVKPQYERNTRDVC